MFGRDFFDAVGCFKRCDGIVFSNPWEKVQRVGAEKFFEVHIHSLKVGYSLRLWLT